MVLSLVAVGMFSLASHQTEQIDIKKKARTERCTALCKPRGGMSHWTTIKVGFGAFQRLCVCWDTTETRLP